MSEAKGSSGNHSPARATREYLWFAITLLLITVLVGTATHV
jgi:hypothetical protein